MDESYWSYDITIELKTHIYIEDITRLREDMDFMFKWQEQYLEKGTDIVATRT